VFTSKMPENSFASRVHIRNHWGKGTYCAQCYLADVECGFLSNHSRVGPHFSLFLGINIKDPYFLGKKVLIALNVTWCRVLKSKGKRYLLRSMLLVLPVTRLLTFLFLDVVALVIVLEVVVVVIVLDETILEFLAVLVILLDVVVLVLAVLVIFLVLVLGFRLDVDVLKILLPDETILVTLLDATILLDAVARRYYSF
ncbi:15912_t:CDS:2, partial [Funneliformis mosseae]